MFVHFFVLVGLLSDQATPFHFFDCMFFFALFWFLFFFSTVHSFCRFLSFCLLDQSCFPRNVCSFSLFNLFISGKHLVFCFFVVCSYFFVAFVYSHGLAADPGLRDLPFFPVPIDSPTFTYSISLFLSLHVYSNHMTFIIMIIPLFLLFTFCFCHISEFPPVLCNIENIFIPAFN